MHLSSVFWGISENRLSWGKEVPLYDDDLFYIPFIII